MSLMDLAEKHRPETFKEVIGNKVAVTLTEAMIVNGMLEDNILYESDFAGVGKTTLAKIVAGIVGNETDTIQLDAATKGGVDNIRKIEEVCQFAPLIGKQKVIIIEEAHSLSKAAKEAFLIMLENRPDSAVFIFCTTEPFKLKDTILSRFTRIPVFPPTFPELLIHIQGISKKEGFNISDEILNLICKNSQGSVRSALKLLKTVSKLEEEMQLSYLEAIPEKTLGRWCEALIHGSLKERNEVVQKILNYDASNLTILTKMFRHMVSTYLPNNSKLIQMCKIQTDRDEYIEIYDTLVEWVHNFKEFIWNFITNGKNSELLEASLPFLTYSTIINKGRISMSTDFKNSKILDNIKEILNNYPAGNLKDSKYEIFDDYLIVTTPKGSKIEISASLTNCNECKLGMFYPFSLEVIKLSPHLTVKELFAVRGLVQK